MDDVVPAQDIERPVDRRRRSPRSHSPCPRPRAPAPSRPPCPASLRAATGRAGRPSGLLDFSITENMPIALERPGSGHRRQRAPRRRPRQRAADVARRLLVGHERRPAVEILGRRRAQDQPFGLQRRPQHLAPPGGSLDHPRSAPRGSPVAARRGRHRRCGPPAPRRNRGMRPSRPSRPSRPQGKPPSCRAGANAISLANGSAGSAKPFG